MPSSGRPAAYGGTGRARGSTAAWIWPLGLLALYLFFAVTVFNWYGARPPASQDADDPARSLRASGTHDGSCSIWRCSCQGLSDTFGTAPGTAAAPIPDARDYWATHKCKTSPAAPGTAGLDMGTGPAAASKPTGVQDAAPAHKDKVPTAVEALDTTIAAAIAAATDRAATQSASRDEVDEPCSLWTCTCQGLSNRYGTYPTRFVNAEPGPVIDFWMAHSCTTVPEPGVSRQWALSGASLRAARAQAAGEKVAPVLGGKEFKPGHLKGFRVALATLPPIPKIAHFTWKETFELGDWNKNRMIANGWGKFKELNPDWEVVISDDAEIAQYLRTKLSAAEWATMEHVGVVGKTDLWRLLKIYHEGGVYFDIDRLVNIPMAEVLADPAARAVLPSFRSRGLRNTQRFDDMAQDFMCSAPGNPIHKTAIKFLLDRRLYCHTHPEDNPKVCTTAEDRTLWAGPSSYMAATSSAILGEELQLRQHLKQKMRVFFDSTLAFLEPQIVHYKENPPFNTVLYRPPPWYDEPGAQAKIAAEEEALQDAKDAFFAAFKVSHWGKDTS